MKITVEQFQHEVEKEGLLDLINKHRGNEEMSHLLNRFLVARKYKLKDAMKMIKQDLEWREHEDVLGIRCQTSKEILKGEINPQGKQIHDELFPHGYLGTCRLGRPVLYLRFGKDFDAEKLDKVAKLKHEDLARYNIWMMERVASKMNFEGQWVVVVDLEGWHLGQMTFKNMKYVKQFADKNSLHYPERFAQVVIAFFSIDSGSKGRKDLSDQRAFGLLQVLEVFIPLSLAFPFSSISCSLMRPWLDEVTREKIGLYSSREQVIPEAVSACKLIRILQVDSCNK
eukprot:753074-Hanusia_phi.AAC.1